MAVGGVALKDASRRPGGGLKAVLDRGPAHGRRDFRPGRRNGSIQPNKETSLATMPRLLHTLTDTTVAAGWLGLSATRFLEALRPTEGGADTDVEDRAGAPARSALALTKPTARLMNTSRGPIVVETDLLAALRDGKIAGAGIDIFEREPLPYHHPFRSQANMLATPHIGYVSRGLYARFYQDTVDNIRQWLDARDGR
jgi:hypothetical protein